MPPPKKKIKKDDQDDASAYNTNKRNVMPGGSLEQLNNLNPIILENIKPNNHSPAKKIKLEEQDAVEVKGSKVTVIPAPKSNAVHGWTYQLKLLMLIFIRAIANNYENFKINTENELDFPKFDDASFEYVKDGITYIRIVQVKHVKDESKKIKYEELGPYVEKKKDQSKYRLTTYFESFLKTKKEVKNLIIFTNLSLSDDVPIDLFAEIPILDEIFDVSLPEYKNMVEISLPREQNNMPDGKRPKKLRLNYKTLINHDLYKVFIKIANNFKKIEASASLVEQFCEKFIFATGQPNNNEMNSILENEIFTISKLPISELISAGYFNIFLDWLNNKYENGAALTYENLKNIIPLVKFKAENLSKNLHYEKILKDVKYEETDTTIHQIKEYFKNEDLNKKYFLIFTKFPELTLSKIFQCLEYKNEEDKTNTGECAIIEANSYEIEEHVIETIKLIKYFKFCVIVLHVEVGDDYMKTIFKMVEENKSKVVILKKPESGQCLEDDCCFKGLKSKKEILNRIVKFENSEIQLCKLASIDLLNEFEDPIWLSKLILAGGDFILNKKNTVLPDNKYIERILYYKSTDTDDKLDFQVNCYDHVSSCMCKSFGAHFSEQSITDDSNHKLIILTSKAGMGKTSLLSSISQKNKNKCPNSWTEIIKLTEHVRIFQEYKNNEDVIEFISTKILLYNSFTVQLFKHQIEAGNTVIMFDGFDEVSKKSKDVVLNIIQNLLKTNVRQIWITSRPFKEILENKFCKPSIKLRNFSTQNVIKCFSNYLPHQDTTSKEMKKATFIIRRTEWIYNLDLHVPLYAKMASEYFNSNHIDIFKISIEEFNNREHSGRKLYDDFIKTKYSNFLGIKFGQMDVGHVAQSANNKLLFKKYDNVHKNWALQKLYPQYCIKQNLEENEITVINSIGIASATVNKEDHNVIHFDHRTFAEYFVGRYLIDKLAYGGILDDNILDLMLEVRNDVYFEQFLKDLILPNKIILTNEKHIEKFEKMLNAFFDENTDILDHITSLQICFDNIEAMEFELDCMKYFKYLVNVIFSHDNDLSILFEKYLKELSKQLEKKSLKTFLIETLLTYEFLNTNDGFLWNETSLKIFEKFMKDNFVYGDKAFFEAISNICNCYGDKENTFIECCENIIKSNSMDNFLFSIFSHTLASKKPFPNAIELTRKHLIEASKDSKLEFEEIAKQLNACMI